LGKDRNRQNAPNPPGGAQYVSFGTVMEPEVED
jgi:hypothetical protein